MPEITVIVPVFQVERYLDRCVQSIINQTFRDYECILVDDGSLDTSGKICDEYALNDHRFKVIHKENGGLSSARNIALNQVKGDYICFVDSDDVIHPEMLERMLEISKSTSSDIVSTGLHVFKNDDYAFDELNELTYEKLQKEDFIDHLYPNNFGKISVTACGKLYRKHIFENLRFQEGIIYEDLHLYLDILKECTLITVLNCSLYYYYVNDVSITKSNYLKYERFGEFVVREKYVHYFNKKQLFDQAKLAENDYLTFFMRNYFAVILKYRARLNDLKPHIEVYKGHLKGIISNPYVCRMRKVCGLGMLVFPRLSYMITKYTIPDCLLEEMR